MKNYSVLFMAMGLSAAALALAATSRSQPTPLVPEPYVQGTSTELFSTFSEFDPSRWYLSDGWRNGNWAANDWRKEQIAFSDGATITLGPNSSSETKLSSGEIQTKDTFGHGYFEARLQAASGSGVVTGFFSYIGPVHGKTWNEIDFEFLGNKPRQALVSYFLGDKNISVPIDLDFDATVGIHHYAFEWYPGVIRWYIDDRLVHEENGEKLTLPDTPQKIYFSVWGSDTLTDWLGPLNRTALPTSARVECFSFSKDRQSGGKCRNGESGKP